MKTFRFSSLLAASLLLAATAFANQSRTILEKAGDLGKFTTFLSLARESGFDQELRETLALTVFAPNDAAFRKVSPEVLNALRDDKDLLRLVLRHHTRTGKLYSFNLQKGPFLMESGQRAHIRTGPNGSAKINQAVVLLKDVDCTNGLIHVVNDLILPPSVIEELRSRGIDVW